MPLSHSITGELSQTLQELARRTPGSETKLQDLANKIHYLAEEGLLLAPDLDVIEEHLDVLQLTEADLNDLKIQALRSLIREILADQVVTDDEFARLKAFQASVQFQAGPDHILHDEMADVLRLYHHPSVN
jgi:hypothetical protein